MAERPKLTLALNCYKVERFVAEAVEGAFVQTYRPLEIVISDDHSPDGTWAKIADTVMRLGGFEPSDDASWQKSNFSGTVDLEAASDLRLVLNRNEKNFGLALHENRLFELSHGEWIAFQAGDDVSLPNRMETIAKHVIRDPGIRCLHCWLEVIDADGRPFKMADDFKKVSKGKGSGLPWVVGAGAVYHRDVYWKFGPLGTKVRNEDIVLPLRASLLGPIELIQDWLVRYRKHGDNASGCFSVDIMDAARYRLRLIHSYYQELEDLHTVEERGMVDAKRVIAKYRKLILHDMEIQWVLGHWTLHPQMRGQVLRHFLTSPCLWALFARRLVGRFFS